MLYSGPDIQSADNSYSPAWMYLIGSLIRASELLCTLGVPHVYSSSSSLVIWNVNTFPSLLNSFWLSTRIRMPIGPLKNWGSGTGAMPVILVLSVQVSVMTFSDRPVSCRLKPWAWLWVPMMSEKTTRLSQSRSSLRAASIMFTVSYSDFSCWRRLALIDQGRLGWCRNLKQRVVVL